MFPAFRIPRTDKALRYVPEQPKVFIHLSVDDLHPLAIIGGCRKGVV